MSTALKSALLSALFVLLLAQQVAAAARYTEHRLYSDERQLDVYLDTEFGRNRQTELLEWIDELGEALATVYGHWPRKHWSLSVSPVSSAGADPIPWAEVHRGTVDRIDFFIQASARKQQLRKSWTGYHEVAHLLIPYRGQGDAWFSEGLASYYQNLLQARSGVLSETEMWQELHDGFQRGVNDNRYPQQTLGELSTRFRETRSFMRVYWSGAWYFLAAEVRLRQQSAGKLGLDQALQQLNSCCAEQSLSVPEMVHQLDETNRVLLFQPLYDEVSASKSVPPHRDIYASLGIEIKGGRVRLQDKGPGAELRRKIYLGKAL